MGFKQRIAILKTLDYRYAIIELLLIISGILIAFGIDTRWQEFQNQQKQQNYLQALKTELQDNREAYQQHLEHLEHENSSTSLFISRMLNGKYSRQAQADCLYKMLWTLKDIETTLPTRAVLEDIINSGGMQLIRSDIMRRGLASYEQSMDHNWNKQQSLSRRWNDIISSYTLDHMNLSQMLPGAGTAADPDKKSHSIPELKYDTDFGQLREKGFLNRLAQRILLINELRDSNRKVISHIETLLYLIETQLNPNQTSTTISE